MGRETPSNGRGARKSRGALALPVRSVHSLLQLKPGRDGERQGEPRDDREMPRRAERRREGPRRAEERPKNAEMGRETPRPGSSKTGRETPSSGHGARRSRGAPTPSVHSAHPLLQLGCFLHSQGPDAAERSHRRDAEDAEDARPHPPASSKQQETQISESTGHTGPCSRHSAPDTRRSGRQSKQKFG